METSVTASLLAALRAQGHSWYRIARLLDTTEQNVSLYRKAKVRMGPNTAARACALLHLSEDQTAATLAALEAERATTDATRAAWEHIVRRLGGLAAGVLLMLGGPGGPSGGAQAAPHKGAAGADAVYYVKPKRRRRATWAAPLLRLLSCLRPPILA